MSHQSQQVAHDWNPGAHEGRFRGDMFAYPQLDQSQQPIGEKKTRKDKESRHSYCGKSSGEGASLQAV